MKKILVILLAGMMAISLTACNGSSKSDETSEEEDTDNPAEEEDSTIVLENFEGSVMVYEDGDDTFEVKCIELEDDGLFINYEVHAASNGYRSGAEIGGLILNGCYINQYLEFCDERTSDYGSDITTYGEAWMRVKGEILTALGITELEEVGFSVSLYDYSDYGSHEHVSFDVAIYPGSAKEVTYEPGDSAVVLLDNEDITLSIAGGLWYTHASGWLLGYRPLIYCRNNSDAECSVSINSITLEDLDSNFSSYTFSPIELPIVVTPYITFEDDDAKSGMSYDDAVSTMSSLNATIEITYYAEGDEEGVTSTIETDLMALSGPFTPSEEE